MNSIELYILSPCPGFDPKNFWEPWEETRLVVREHVCCTCPHFLEGCYRTGSVAVGRDTVQKSSGTSRAVPLNVMPPLSSASVSTTLRRVLQLSRTTHNAFYLKTESVPRSKHTQSRLQERNYSVS